LLSFSGRVVRRGFFHITGNRGAHRHIGWRSCRLSADFCHGAIRFRSRREELGLRFQSMGIRLLGISSRSSSWTRSAQACSPNSAPSSCLCDIHKSRQHFFSHLLAAVAPASGRSAEHYFLVTTHRLLSLYLFFAPFLQKISLAIGISPELLHHSTLQIPS